MKKQQLLMGTSEAAAALGLQKSNFIRDVVNGDIGFPPPLATLACGRVWLTAIVLEWKARAWDGTSKRRQQ